AVALVLADVELAAVRRVRVAVGEARDAGRDGAGAVHAAGDRVRHRAGERARAAVHRIGGERGLAAVSARRLQVAVAVAEQRPADPTAGAGLADPRRAGRGIARRIAAAAVPRIVIEVDAGAAALGQPGAALAGAGAGVAH